MKRLFGWLLVSAGMLGLVAAAGCAPADDPPQECAGSGCPDDDSEDPDAGGADATCGGCVAEGMCVEETSDEACGSGGEACTECGPTETCSQAGDCVERECHSGNCDGCCRDGTCVEEVSDSACGSGGQTCAECGEASKCIEGSCETCGDGCWQDGECVGGDSGEACGSSGESCVSCGSNETCREGDCVEQSADDCAADCDGCCSGNECVPQGELGDARCGSGGESCVSCDEGLTCNASGSCTVEDDAEWDVVAVGADIDEETVEGDQATGPDPFAEVTIGDTTEQTSVIHDEYEPHWNETTVTGVTAEEIEGMSYILWDEDSTPWIGDDKIVADCEPNFTGEDVASGTATHSCTGGKHENNQATTEFRFEAASSDSE